MKTWKWINQPAVVRFRIKKFILLPGGKGESFHSSQALPKKKTEPDSIACDGESKWYPVVSPTGRFAYD